MHVREVKRWKGKAVRALTVALVAAAAGCGKQQQQGPPPAFPPTEVGIVTVAPRTLPATYEFVGQVQPSRRVDVRARVDGIIEARSFTEGGVVTAGQTLYRLDRVRYDAVYQGALARYDNAKRTLARIEPLLPRHAVAQQDVDNAKAAVDAAKAALDQARKDLDDTEVHAEITGQVGRSRLEVGARVTGPADLLTTIDQLDPVYVIFRPSTQQLQSWQEDPASRRLIQPGSPLVVRVALSDGTLAPNSGHLSFVAPSVDSATGTLEFRAEMANRSHSLVPGQFVRARLVGFTHAGAIGVPQRAIQQGLGRQFVYVVGVGDTVQVRDVQTGPWSGDLWIVTHGLRAADRVVVDGIQKVGPGRVVKPVPLGSSDSTKAGAGAPRGAAPGKKP